MIPGHECGVLVGGERGQVVVSGILGGSRRRLVGVLHDRGRALQPFDDRGCLALVNSVSEIRVGECWLGSASSSGDATSSNAPALQALTIAAGVPAGASRAEMMTLGSRTARNG